MNKKQKRVSNKKFSDKKGKKPMKNFSKPSEIKLEEISGNLIGSVVTLKGVIDKIAQTSGPTLFTVSDGTGSLTLKGFTKPGVRAYAELEEGNSIHAKVKLNEYNEAFEGEILSVSKLSEAQSNHLEKEIQEKLKEKSQPPKTDFLIKAPELDKLKERFIQAATEIRLAIVQNRPIIVRHHNDADGYASGFSLERAILPLIEKQHGYGKAAWEFYLRAPCAAPFYEIDDSIRDSAMSLRNVAKFSNKMPLVIIADNGSSPEDLFAIQHGKVHGMEFIVVDHHFFDEDVISPEVLVHINPFLVGEDGSNFSAGMLCTELARFINPVKNIEEIAAMAGLADRVDNPKAMEQYLELAKKEGYSRELLVDIAAMIDFVSAKLRFMEAREYIESVFGQPREKQKKLIDLMVPYIRGLENTGLKIAKAAAKTEKLGKTTLQYLFVEESLPGFGFYPKPGKTVGMLHDDYQTKAKSLVTAGVMNSAITLRATDEANFSVHDLLNFFKEKLPEAFANGGGHKNAGSISFIPSKKDEIFELLKEFIKNR